MTDETDIKPVDTNIEEKQTTVSTSDGDSKTVIERSEKVGIASALNDPETFKNRRRMAWLCLVSLLLSFAYILIFFDITRINPLEGIIGGYFAAMTTVVLTYFGVSTIQSISWQKNSKKE